MMHLSSSRDCVRRPWGQLYHLIDFKAATLVLKLQFCPMVVLEYIKASMAYGQMNEAIKITRLSIRAILRSRSVLQYKVIVTELIQHPIKSNELMA